MQNWQPNDQQGQNRQPQQPQQQPQQYVRREPWENEYPAYQNQGAYEQREAPGVREQQSRRAGRFGALRGANSPESNKPHKEHKPGFFSRTVNAWFNRIIGAAAQGSFSDQQELYAAHRTTRDYVWNTVAVAIWGFVFPLLTIIVTQVVGPEQGGMFSMAFVVGTLLMFIGNYGVRTYQVSDLKEAHSFTDYQTNRWVTCFAMVVVGILYCVIRGYAENMFAISMGVYLYKMIDGLADVYEGRLQQADKLYLAGISLALRSVAVIIVFSACLFLTRSLSVACIGMAIAALISFVIVTFPLALLETPKSNKRSFTSIKALFKQCFPLFIALFSFALIDTMPRFIMESTLAYDNQLYFYVLCFPASAIVSGIGFIYKPQLLRLASLWADPKQHRQFDFMIWAIIGAIVLLAIIMIVIVATVGIPIISFLYGIDLESFRSLFYVMLAAGAVMATIDFLYQVITVLRKQMAVMKLYLITFGFALFIPLLLISFTGLPGAVLSYLIIMSILLVLLVMEFLRIRSTFAREFAVLLAAEPKKSSRRTPRQESRRKQRSEKGVQNNGEQSNNAPSLGAQSFGAQNLGAQTPGAQNYNAQNYNAQTPGAQNYNAQNYGAPNPGAQTFGAQNLAAQNLGAPNYNTQNHGTQNYGAPIYGTPNYGGQHEDYRRLRARPAEPITHFDEEADDDSVH